MRLHVEAWGAGRPLVLLHGFTGGIVTWEPARALLGAGRRVIAVDLPGHGASPPPGPAERLHDLADELVALLDHRAIRRADWLGYSLGGRVALHVALGHPARIRRLVLESTSPGERDPAGRAARAAADDALAATLERDGLDAFVTRWMARPLFASQRGLDPAVLARERRLRLAQTAAGLAGVLRAFSVGRQASLWDALPAIAVPVLVVAGGDDDRYPALARAMAAALPAARLVLVPGAGHAVHLEEPVPFWSAVCAFLASGDDASREGDSA